MSWQTQYTPPISIFKKSLKLFSPVKIELDLLDLEEHIKCQGRVVWSVQRKEDKQKKPFFYDIGIEFVNVKDKDYQRLEKTILLLKQGRKAIYS